MTSGGKLKEAIARANQLTSDRTYTQSGGLLYSMGCAQRCECVPCNLECCPTLFDASRIPPKAACAIPCGLGCCSHLIGATAVANSGTTTAAAPGDNVRSSSNTGAPNANISTSNAASTTNTVITLAIKYMCGAKEATFVQDTVGAREGVKSITVSFADKQAVIAYDAALETPATLVDSVDEMGFEASVVAVVAPAIVLVASSASSAILQAEDEMVVLEVD